MTLIRYIPYVSNDAKSIVSGWPESQFPSPTEVRSIEDSWNTDRGTRVLGTGFLIISWLCFSCKKRRRRKELYKLYIVKYIHIELKYSKTKRARKVVPWWQGSQEINIENLKSKWPIRTPISQIIQKPECFKVKKIFEFRNFIPYSDRGYVAKTPSIIFRCNEQDIWTCWG